MAASGTRLLSPARRHHPGHYINPPERQQATGPPSAHRPLHEIHSKPVVTSRTPWKGGFTHTREHSGNRPARPTTRCALRWPGGAWLLGVRAYSTAVPCPSPSPSLLPRIAQLALRQHAAAQTSSRRDALAEGASSVAQHSPPWRRPR